jgi:hypothetical protein
LELRQRSIGLHGAKQRVCKTSESGANERHIIDCGAKLHRVLKLFGHLCNNVNNTKDTRKSTKTEERKKKKKKKKNVTFDVMDARRVHFCNSNVGFDFVGNRAGFRSQNALQNVLSQLQASNKIFLVKQLIASLLICS